MQQALTTIQTHASDQWKAWLGSMLVDNPNGLGSELVEALPGPNNTHDADQLLAAAERLGWIERTAFAPSVSQQTFLGLQYPGGVEKAPTARAFHGQLHMYRIVDRAAVESHVGSAKPERAKYELGDVVKYRPAFVAQIQGGARMRKMVGRVVGFSTLRTNAGAKFPRVSWDDDPQTEPECEQPIEDPPRCPLAGKGALRNCPCPRVPYRARAVSPAAIVKA